MTLPPWKISLLRPCWVCCYDYCIDAQLQNCVVCCLAHNWVHNIQCLLHKTKVPTWCMMLALEGRVERKMADCFWTLSHFENGCDFKWHLYICAYVSRCLFVGQALIFQQASNRGRGGVKFGCGREVLPRNLKVDPYKYKISRKSDPFIYQSVQIWLNFWAILPDFFPILAKIWGKQTIHIPNSVFCKWSFIYQKADFATHVGGMSLPKPNLSNLPPPGNSVCVLVLPCIPYTVTSHSFSKWAQCYILDLLSWFPSTNIPDKC